MPIYKLNGDTYDIPDDVVADFEKDNPSATITYHADGDEYEIPVSERDGFLKEFPEATTGSQTPGPGSTKQPMMDAMMQQKKADAPAPAPSPAPASIPTEKKKTGGYKPSAQEMAGFQSTIDNAGFTAATAAPSFEKKAANLQKRQGLKAPKQVKVGETGNLVEGEQHLNPDTGQLEQTYITSQGNEYVNKAQAENEQRQIDDYDRRLRYATGQGIDTLSEKYVNPLVDKAMKDADDRWFASMKESSSVPMGEGMEMFALRRANEAADPEKILQGLQKSLEESYKNPEMQKEIDRLAESIGVSREEYLQQILAPSLAQRLENTFASSQIARNMPRNATEYILQGLSNSIGGMLMGAATETKGQRFYKNQAEAMTEQGNNPYYQPGTAASLVKMGVSFAADAPFFGVYGRVSGQVAKNIAERQISKMVAEGLSETAARSIVGTALENSVGARMKNSIMQHIVGGALTMGAYNATSETARQIRDKEGLDLGQIAGSTLEGLAVGSAFGVTGGAVQALSQPLSGFSKIGAKIAGFGAEAETMYATEELSKMAHGQEGFENPFEGSVEALMKLGVMKATGPDGLKKIAGEILHPIKSNQQQRTGIKFTDEEQAYVRNTQEGQKLIDALSQMHPGRAISEVNGKKRLTEEGEALRLQLSQNYEDFMNNKDIPASVKQKVAGVLGGVYRPGLETGADIIQNEDGSVLVKTRDKDGNCIQDLKFDDLADAEKWRTSHQSECRRNDAVNMWNGATDAERQDIVNTVRDNVSGKAVLDEMKSQTEGMKQNRLKRQLEKINKTAEQYEGRELTDEEARNFIQTVIRDGDDATFEEIYQLIHDKAYPKDMPDTKRNYWEGQQLDPLQKHFAQTDAQLAEERLMLQGEDFAKEVMDDAQYPDEKIAELASRLVQGDITKDQFDAAVDYYNKMSKVNGMLDETLKDIDNQVEAANSYVRKNTHADSGSLIDAVYAQKPDRQYYVTAGHFEVTPDGKLKPTDNSGMVILRDKETGEIEVVSPSEITVSHIDDPNRVIAENESMEGLRGQLMKEADDVIDLHPDTPTEAMNGDIYTGADGNQYMVMQIQDEAGNPVGVKIAIDETGNPVGNPMPFDMEEYRKAKSNEIDAAERPQEETVLPEDNQVTTEPQPLKEPAAEAAVGAPEQETKPAGGEASVEKGTGVNEPSAAVSLKVPVDENGKKLYEQAKPEDALSDLAAEFGEEEAQQMVSQMVENTDKALKALQEQDTSDMTDMNDIRSHMEKIKELQKKRDFWQGLVKNSTEADEQKIEAGQSVDIQHPSGESGGNREDGQDKIQAQSTERQAGTDTQQQQTEGSKDDTGVAPVSDTDVSGGTRVEQQPEGPTAEQKVAQGTVKNNIGKRFEFQNQDGTRSEVIINAFKDNDKVEVTRQDYDAQGQPNGEPYSQDLNMVDVGNSIVNRSLKPVLSVEERLRNAFKGKVGMQNVIDVLSDEEQRRMLDAYERKDEEAIKEMTHEFLESHREDIILNERDKRNSNVARIMEGGGSREDKLRRVRKEFQGYDDAVIALSDEALQPTTLEEYVADLHGRQPKAGEGPLAYFSYDQDGKKVVGMQDESGYGTKTGGDTRGFAPWLAPKGRGMSLQQYAENIHSQLPEALQQRYSDQDVRNAILDVFGGAERPSDITTMIIKRGVIQAEQAARRMEEQWIDGGVSYQKVAVDQNSFAGRLERAKQQTNTEPTEAQKDKGNYKKGHVSFGGYDFVVENPEGSMRRGTDADGKSWEQKMHNTYGYILGKYGKDGDHLDMFINDQADLDNWNGNVYVVDQVDPKTGRFDEHKILYGFDSLDEAKRAYLSNYEEGWQGLGRISGVTKDTFDKWLDSSKQKIKEFASHSIPNEHMVETDHASFDSALRQLDEREISIDNKDLLKDYGLKNVTLSRTGDHLTLTHFVAAEQGKGSGTRFMEDLARLADERGWTLALTPDDSFGASSVKRLKDFYKRFGFVDNKGRNSDFYTRESMIRRPKEFLEKPENQEKVIRDAVVEYLRSKGIEVSTDWKLGQKILDDYNSRVANREDAEGYEVKPQKVTDQQTLDELNKGKTVKRYRAMQLIDGKLYPPMSAKVDGEMRQPTEIGVWEQAEERPDLIKNGKFVLNKGQKGQGNVPAAYNPYFHTSTSGLNDQFTSAYKRPELVVVEVDIPESELTSGYKAEGAKDAVGNVDWHSGVVNGQLPADRQRQVTLSRYSKVNRIVPDSEVADMIVKQLEGTNVEVPYNVVTPQLRKELETRGVKISDKPAGSVTEDINGNPIEKGARYFKTGDGYAYGYTLGGKIYLDPRIATSETPIHEYGHLWAEMKRQTDHEEWDQIKQAMLNDKMVQPIIDRVKRDYPELAREGKEDDFIEEVITQFSGKRGAERLREIADEVAAERGGIFGKAEAVTAMQRLKNILNRFWEGVARMMGWKYTNANQIADRIMADMLNGVDPTKMAKDAGRLRPKAEMLKQVQLDMILKNNPANDADMPGHTWIRSIEDIKSFKEALEYDGLSADENVTPDFTAEMVKDALKNGLVTVYSSKPIKNGIFVTPSKMEAQNYAGDGKVYSKKVPLSDVAWIDATQGQYAEVSNPNFQMVGKEGAANADKAEGTTTRQDNMSVAEDMEKVGKDAKAIKYATGWERGADGKWRYEIPDADADILSKYKAKVDEMKADGVESPEPILKLGELLGEDNELFRYYPKIKDMPVLFSRGLPVGTAGAYDKGAVELNIKELNRFEGDDLNNENVYGTLLHEVQHAIQGIEGFARGGNLQTSTTEDGINAIIEKKERQRADIKTRLDANNKILSDPENLKMSAELEGKTEKEVRDQLTETVDQQAAEYDTLGLQIDRLRHTKAPAMTDARDLYHRLAGEVESRNVTERMGMTEEKRRQSLASETEDVPREEQVIIMGDGTAMNINDIKPVGKGDFGDIYDQFKGKPKEAVDFLIKKKGGDLLGVFHRDEVGDIDLVWGESHNPYKGKGLSHIIRKHIDTLHDFKDIDDLSDKLDDVVNNGNIGFNGNNIEITKDGYRVVLAQENDGKKWILTAFDNSKTKKEKLSSANTPGTPIDNSGSRAVAADDASLSEGKDTKNINTVQEKTEESASGAQENENNSLKFQRVGSPEPEMTPEDRQYWKKWDAAMKKWKERNAIPADQMQAPEKPRYQQGESALDYAQKLVQWNRMKALWQTAPKLEDYRQVRDDKDVVEAARENEQRYPDSPSAKTRMVASDMMRLRHAMSRQKAYDKATVKAVTDFAQDFMKLGFGDNLSRGEMERMLSSVKNATGAKDIRKEVDNIMNILADNYLRNLENQVTKLSSVKELSKTAQGVEKQGRLELKGQRMIQAFRDAREKRMTLDQINERMAKVAEKMNRSDDEAPMWEQEYEGLSIARQYVENIEGSREEWADLDTLYKDAVKDYKTSGRSYKDQQEYLESLEQAMQENKIDRIGLYGDIIGRLQGNISESMQGAKEFVEREKQRQKHIWDMANFDLAGKETGAMREKTKGKPANFFLQPLGTFEQMLKQFGSRNANGEGYLYDYFMRNWMDATDKAFINEQKAKEDLDAKAREVFGGKVKRWSDLYDISRSLPTLDVEVLDGEEPKTFKLTQGNLLYIYMADKMIDGRMKLRKMGIDEEAVEKIKDFMDPRLVQLGDWLQGEYLPQKRTEYNKVHERMFGAPMAAIDNYFPLKVLGDARYQEQDVNVPDSETLPSTITGNIIKRRKNALPLDILHTDALSLAIEHVEDMERWAAQAEWNKDINTLLSYTTFRNKVKNMDTIYGSGDALWNSFKDAAKMAAGTYNPSVKPGHVDAAISNIAKGVTAAKINFRVYTAFKQLLSAPAFLHDVNLADFAHDAVNPYGSWKWAMENMPVFQKRWKSRQVGDTRLMDDPTDWKLWKTNVVQMATRLGMSPNALVDGVTCAVGARSIYKSRYKKYKEIGASDEVAHKRALQDAEIGYNLTQQSSEGAFVSAIQKDRTVAANMLSVFRNSSMAYTRQWVDAARNLKKRAQNGYKEDSIKFMTRQMQEQFGIDEDQAKRAAELEYAREGRRDVARLLNMMFGVTVAWNLGASLPYLLIGDDDHTKKEMLTDALMKGMLAGPTEGLAAGNLYSDFIGRTLANEQTRNTFKEEGIGAALDNALKQGGDYEVNPLPLMADIQSMIKKMGYDKYAAAQDVFNIAMQSAVGVNPQTFTDMWNAAMDYGAPGWDGRSYYPDDENLTRPKELALFMMRLMNAPTSSWSNKYIDELGMNAEDAKKLPYEEMARRYAHYKHWKDAPLMGWLRGEEGRQEKMGKIRKQFDDAVTERMQRLTDDELMHNVARSESAEEKRRYAKIIAQRLGIEPGEDSQKADEKKNWYQNIYQRNMLYEDIKEDEMLADEYRNLENAFKEKREEAERKSVQDLKDFNEANKEWKERIAEAKKEAGNRIDWIRGGKWNTPSGKKGSSKKANLLAPGKKQLETGEDTEAIMKNIRQWRKEALEILMRAEAEK